MDAPSSGMLMGGDSIDNDIFFGKAAGVQTALLVHKEDFTVDDGDSHKKHDVANIHMQHLSQLPRAIWTSYDIGGYLGTENYKTGPQMHGLPAPTPSSKLGKAIVQGDLPQVEKLLNDLSVREIVQAEEDDSNNTALIWAAEVGNDEMVSLVFETLLDKLGDKYLDQVMEFMTHRGYLGATAVTRAARRGHTSTLEILLQNIDRASPDTRLARLIDTPNDKLQFPLHFTAFKQHPETLKVLLRYGANPWVMDRKGRLPYQDTSCKVCKAILRDAMEEKTLVES
ncbi:MAG: hypothetical protein SGARI_008343 [Bacillariaceae sp.]